MTSNKDLPNPLDPKSHFIYITVACLLATFCWPSLGGETWGYWTFADELFETGRFVHPDRAPVISLFLIPFLCFDFPLRVYTPLLLTTYFFIFSLHICLPKKYVHGSIFCVAVIALINLHNEPFIQMISLAIIFIAVRLRLTQPKTIFIIAIFYNLLMIAALIRGITAIVLLSYLVYDMFRFLKKWRKIRSILNCSVRREFYCTTRELFSSAVLTILITALIYNINTNQSRHPWNNVWLTDVNWIPSGKESLVNAAITGHINWFVAELPENTSGSKDIYFTNPHFFDNKTTAVEIITARPDLYFKFLIYNVRALAASLRQIIGPPLQLRERVGDITYTSLLFLALVLVLYCSWAIHRNRNCPVDIKIMAVSSYLTVCILVLIGPKDRYLGFLAVHILISIFYSNIPNLKYLTTLKSKFIVPVIVSILFAPVSVKLYEAFSNTWHSVHRGQFLESLLIEKDISVYRALRSVTASCHGIMSLEHNYFAAFFSSALRSYSVFEIPPNRSVDVEPYSGLQEDRVNCLGISNGLTNTEGLGTTTRARFEDYISRYKNYLLFKGAMEYIVPGYGVVVVLENSRAN